MAKYIGRVSATEVYELEQADYLLMQNSKLLGELKRLGYYVQLKKIIPRQGWEKKFDICFPVNKTDFSEESKKIKDFIRRNFIYDINNG